MTLRSSGSGTTAAPRCRRRPPTVARDRPNTARGFPAARSANSPTRRHGIRTTLGAMDEPFTVDRVAWQREKAQHHYVGTLSASGEGVRLAGHDPFTGIRIGLRIPVEEIA